MVFDNTHRSMKLMKMNNSWEATGCEGSCIVNVCFGRKSAANLCDLYLILINHSPHLHNPHDQLLATSVLARGIN